MKRELVFVLLLISGFAYSQQKPGKQYAGRVLSPLDSALVNEYFFEGLKAKTIQNLQLAEDYFRRTIEIDPANGASLYELGSLYHSQNRESEAELFAGEATAADPENEWYWLLLADIYKKNNNWPSLENALDQLIRISPDRDDYYFDKANVLFLQNKYSEAEKVYNVIDEKFGQTENLTSARQRISLKQGKPEKVIAELEAQIKNHPEELRNYLLLADLYVQEKKLEKALGVLQKAAVAEPKNAFVHASLSDLYRMMGKHAEAFSELKAAFAAPDMDIDAKVKIVLAYFSNFSNAATRAQAEELASIIVQTHPADPKGYAVYGDVLYQQQKLSQAKEVYKKALALDAQVYLIWEQVLRIELTLNELPQAIADGEEALSIFPNQAPLYLYTGIAYNQTGNGAKAISYLNNAVSLETEDKELQVQIYSSLGDAYHSQKNYHESDKAFGKALELSPDDVYALNNYAYYLSLREEQLDKAEKMSRRSNELSPDNASFQDTYAWILFKQKKYQDARVWIERAIRNESKSNPTQLEHYGDILFHTGDKEKAIAQWKKARNYGSVSKQLERKINEKKYFE